MSRTALAVIAISSILVACSQTVVVTPPKPSSSRGPSTAATLGIPPGHLPPVGQCRIWIPGTPPGHQAPSGDCASLARRVPRDGWLVYRPSKNKKEVKVSVYDARKPGVVVVIRFFDSKSGKMLREEGPSAGR